MAEMLAVPAAPAALLHPVVLRQTQRGLADDTRDGRQPFMLQIGSIDHGPPVDQPALAVVDKKHLAGEGPEIVDRRLRPCVTFPGAVAEPDHPLGGMPQMIGALLL